jgi:hypothetical protein
MAVKACSKSSHPPMKMTAATSLNGRSNSTNDDTLPGAAGGRNLKMKVPLQRSESGSQKQRVRAKVMTITTISEDSPLEADPTPADLEDSSCSNRRNGVRRSRSLGGSKSLSGDCRPNKKPEQRRSQSEGRKTIHWNQRVEKKRHHRLQDLTNEEKQDVWYTEDDTKFILAMAKVTVKMMMKGEPCDDVDYCSRGLEGKTPTGSKQRQKNKLKVRRALLEEQQLQRNEGINDPEYLAQVSMRHSKDICIEARNAALRDEDDTREYMSSGIACRDRSPVPPRRAKR